MAMARHALPGKGVVTVEVLNQLIRENPANMTQAVRTWLGRAKPRELIPFMDTSAALLQSDSMTKLQKLAALLIILGPDSASADAQKSRGR